MDEKASIPGSFTNTTSKCRTDLGCGDTGFTSIAEEPTGKSNQRSPGAMCSSCRSASYVGTLVEWQVAMVGVECPAKDGVVVRSPTMLLGRADTNVGTRGG